MENTNTGSNTPSTPAPQPAASPAPTGTGNSPVNNGAPANATPAATENGSQETKQPNAAPEIKPNLKKFKLKVQGKEIEEELDLNDEKALTRYLQLAKNANFVTQSAREREKELIAREQQYNELIKSAKERKGDFFNHFGFSKDDLIDYLADQEIEASLPPEVKENRELKKKLAEREEQEQKVQQMEKQRQHELQVEETVSRLEKDILGVIGKNGLLENFDPKAPNQITIDAIEGIAKTMAEAKQQGFQLTAEEAYGEWQENRKEIAQHFIQSLTDKELLKLLGDERMERVRKTNLEMLRATSVSGKTESAESGAPQSQDGKPKPPVHMRDWLKLK